ncbi:MAG: arginine repressor [Hyphomicrobiales bacterium]
MRDKAYRLNKIGEIIKRHEITSQEQLLNMLLEAGIKTTQATLSRDLRALKVLKVPHAIKGYIYAISETRIDTDEEKIRYLANAFKSISFSKNIAVIKTQPAYANSLALIIDQFELNDIIIGSLAGDDTVILVLNEDIEDRQIVKDALIRMLPTLKGRI